MKYLRVDQYVMLLAVSLILLSLPLINKQVLGQKSVEPIAELELIPVAPVPVLKPESQAATDFVATVSAQAISVIDGESGSVLLERAAAEKRSPASTTKLMTALVARHMYDLDQVLMVNQESMSTGTAMGLVSGEQISAQNVFYGLLMNSGNDAAFLLANQSPFGYQNFVNQMNTRASQLHLQNSHFTNPSGLDDDDHYMSAADLTLVAREILKDDFLRQIVGTKSKLVTDVSGKITHPLYSTQQLLGVVPGVIGMKTGTTQQAGEALITALERDDHTIIIVILGSTDRYADTQKIIHWIFDNYVWLNVDQL